MALRVQQLNADTTFLLTFTPAFAPERLTKRFPGDYKILIDPWLSGHSSVFHTKFQISYHSAESSITSLADIKQGIDLIIISQDKSDHCHKETLCSLPKNTKINIIASPAAAKKIRSWRYFDPRQVHVMKAYSPSNARSVTKITLPAYSPGSASGEITITNMPAKHDMTKLHNAIGITYQPPSTVLSLNTQFDRYEAGSTVELSSNGISRPSTAPQNPFTAPSSPHSPSAHTLAKSSSHADLSRRYHDFQKPAASTSSRADSGIAQYSSSRANSEKVLSIIYTPHGVPTRTLEPYVREHLTPLNALPVSALFHSINIEENPWFMGGQIAAGAPGGVEIAKVVGVKHWVSAHDEVKDNRGMATTWIRSKRYTDEDVKAMLQEAGLEKVEVHRLGIGEVLRLSEGKGPSKKGMEKKYKKPHMSMEDDGEFAPATAVNWSKGAGTAHNQRCVEVT